MLPDYLIGRGIDEPEIPRTFIQIYPHAIDLVNGSENRSAVYETRCFSFLQERMQKGMLVGPHLVDYMFGNDPSAGGLIRPDALLLTTIEDESVLTGMAEFKSGKGNGFERKLDGFALLLEKLRQKPSMLPEMIYYAVGEYIETPASIVIPPDEEIEITFLSPFEGGVLYDASAAPFPVTYFRVPFQPAA